jgi:ADP-ribose pyrophosphatase YjhB (NUDIX family)
MRTSDNNSDGMMEQSRAIPQWLEWARELQAIAQTSLHYVESDYQRKRLSRILELVAEINETHTSLPVEQWVNTFQAQKGYATPKVDVRSAIFRDGKILMVRERADNGWTLPGGWADVGDIPSQAAEREVWEEAGFHVKVKRVIGVYDANRSGPLEFFQAFKLLFLCEIIDGQPIPSDETSEVAFFALGELPESLSGERTRPRHLANAFAVQADPDIPTFFD